MKRRYDGSGEDGPAAQRYKIGAGDWGLLPASHSELINDKGQITSQGRGQPTQEQSYVMETCYVPKDFAESRTRVDDSECLAPSGSVGAKSIRSGDLVFTEIPTRHSMASTNASSPYDANVKPPEADQGIGGYTDVPVFACVNGLSRKAVIRCVGQAYTDVNENNPSRDTACAVKTRGMATIVNTGPYCFKPGDIVGFTKTPSAIVDETGKMIPRVAVKGWEHDKFVPGLFPISEMLSPSIKLRCISAIHAMIDGENKQMRLKFFEVKDFDTLFVKARNRIRSNFPVGDLTDVIPLDYYIKYQLIMYIKTTIPSNYYDDWAKKALEIRSMHIKDSTSTNTSSILEESKKDDGGDKIFENRASGTVNGTMFFHKLNAWSMEALLEHDAFVDAHKIGRCVKISPAGQPLHIDIGNFSV
jgi:hypothetical protein